MIFDQYPHIYINLRTWVDRDKVEMFRSKVITDEDSIFWARGLPIEEGELGPYRILICGRTGIGKSALVNKVFGVPVVGQILGLNVRSQADLLLRPWCRTIVKAPMILSRPYPRTPILIY
jgi:hypothetical protein